MYTSEQLMERTQDVQPLLRPKLGVDELLQRAV